MLVGIDEGRARPITAPVAARVPAARFAAGEHGEAGEADMRKWAALSRHVHLTRRHVIHARKQTQYRAWENARGAEAPAFKQACDALAACGGTGMGVAQLHAFLDVSRAHRAALSAELLDGPAAIQRAKWGMVRYRADRSQWDRFALKLLAWRESDTGVAGGTPRELVRVEVLMGDVNFASGGRGEESVPTKSLWRKLASAVVRHRLPVRFHAPADEYRTTKCCCACGEVTTSLTTRLRLCTSDECSAGEEWEREEGGEAPPSRRRRKRRAAPATAPQRADDTLVARSRHCRSPHLSAATLKASGNCGTATSMAPATF